MHLKQGDPKPAIDPDRLTLIGYRFCPYVERVRLVLSYHGIDHDLIYVSLSSKPDWFLDLYPMGKVPFLLTNKDKNISESITIMRYLDGLVTSDKSLEKYCDEEKFKEATNIIDKMAFHCYAILQKDCMEADVTAFRVACQSLNDLVKGPYSTGNELCLTDLLIFPFCNLLEVVFARLSGNPPESVREVTASDPLPGYYAQLTAFLVNMRSQPFVAAVRDVAQVHAKYQLTKRSGAPNPDI